MKSLYERKLKQIKKGGVTSPGPLLLGEEAGELLMSASSAKRLSGISAPFLLNLGPGPHVKTRMDLVQTNRSLRTGAVEKVRLNKKLRLKKVRIDSLTGDIY